MTAQQPSMRKAGISLKSLLDDRERQYASILVYKLYQQLGMRLASNDAPAAGRALLSLGAYRTETLLGLDNADTQEAINLLSLHDFNSGDYATALGGFERLYFSCRATWGDRDRLTRIAGVRVWQCRKLLRVAPRQNPTRGSLE